MSTTMRDHGYVVGRHGMIEMYVIEMMLYLKEEDKFPCLNYFEKYRQNECHDSYFKHSYPVPFTPKISLYWDTRLRWC